VKENTMLSLHLKLQSKPKPCGYHLLQQFVLPVAEIY
jgi:hypothetical protein